MKKALVLVTGLVFFSLLFTAGCKEDDTGITPTQTSTPFRLPAVGDHWDYRTITGQDTARMSYEILQRNSNNVYKVLQAYTWPTGIMETDTLYWLITADEFTQVNSPAAVKRGLSFYNGMEPGRDYMFVTWPGHFSNGGDTMYAALISTAVATTVACGAFTCMTLSVKGAAGSMTPETVYYFCRCNGLIKVANRFSVTELLQKNF